MKEKILEALDSLGFKLEEEENLGYSFNYEGLNLLFMYSEDDTNFLNIALPGIYEANDGNVLQVCALMEKINSTLKYVKAYLFGSSVWIFYEHELFGDEDLPLVISRMVLRLESGAQFARKTIAEIEEAMPNGSSDEESGDAVEETVEEETAVEKSDDDNNNE